MMQFSRAPVGLVLDFKRPFPSPSPPLPLPLRPFFLRTIYSFKSFQAPYIRRIQNDKHVAEKVTKDELKLTIAYLLLS